MAQDYIVLGKRSWLLGVMKLMWINVLPGQDPSKRKIDLLKSYVDQFPGRLTLEDLGKLVWRGSIEGVARGALLLTSGGKSKIVDIADCPSMGSQDYFLALHELGLTGNKLSSSNVRIHYVEIGGTMRFLQLWKKRRWLGWAPFSSPRGFLPERKGMRGKIKASIFWAVAKERGLKEQDLDDMRFTLDGSAKPVLDHLLIMSVNRRVISARCLQKSIAPTIGDPDVEAIKESLRKVHHISKEQEDGVSFRIIYI